MSSWRSPMHFRVHDAYRTATRQCTEVSKEDEHHWDWTSSVKRSGEDSGERSRRQQAPSAPIQRRRRLIAATDRSRNQADWQQEKQSQQQAPSMPGGSVLLQRVASSSAQCNQTTVRTLSRIGSQLQLQRRQQPKRQQLPLRRRHVHNFHNDVDGNPNVSPGNIPAVERNPGEVST